MITLRLLQKWVGVAFVFELDNSPTVEFPNISSTTTSTAPISKLEEWKRETHTIQYMILIGIIVERAYLKFHSPFPFLNSSSSFCIL